MPSSLGGQKKGAHSNDLLSRLHLSSGVFAVASVVGITNPAWHNTGLFQLWSEREPVVRIIGLLLVWCLSLNAQAVMVSDLYEMQVAVADQSVASRAPAMQEALMLVLVKVAGEQSAAHHELLQQQLSNPDVFVKSFRYVRDEADGSLQLKVTFAQNLIDDLLRQAQLPVWGKSRPLVLLWQAVEDKRQRLVLNQNDQQWRLQMERAMSERGIPLLWPALDLEDQIALPVGSLWGLFRADVRKACERYMADAQMAGRLAPVAGGGFAYRGFLLHRDETLELSAEGDEVAVVLRQIADQVAVFLAQRYAVRSQNEASGQMIMVSDVDNFRQYHELLAYLLSNNAIDQVHIRSVDNNNLILELDLAADWNQVWSVLALDRRLVATDQPQVYRWQP